MKVSILEFYQHILPSNGINALAYRSPGENFFRHCLFESLDEMAKKSIMLDGQKFDVFMACASYQQGFYKDTLGRKHFRTADNANHVKSFWFDIDCDQIKAEQGKGYLSVNDALIALDTFCRTIGLPIPTIILSGGGLHCYFVLDAEISKSQWVPVAKKLKVLTHQFQLLADDSRTADIASILRPVGTHNWKPERMGKEVELYHLSKAISFDTFSELINARYKHIQPEEVQRPGKPRPDFLETDENKKRIKAALKLLDPNCDRAFWRDICFALHSLGWLCAKDLAKSWSRGDLYDADSR